MQCHHGEPLLREQQCDPVGEAGHDQQPQQSPSAASVPQPAPSEAVPEVLPWAFRYLCRYAPEIFGSVHCTDPFCCAPLYLVSLFLLRYAQKLALRSCTADVLSSSLLLIVHF